MPSLQFACEVSDFGLTKIIFNKYKTKQNAQDSLHKNYGDAKTIAFLTNRINMNMNQSDENKRSLLHIAIAHKDIELIEYIVHKLGINVNKRDKDDKTILHYAVEQGDIDFTKYLISNLSVDINKQDKDGKTTLHYAVEQNCKELVKYLIGKCHIDFSVKDKNNKIAACYAVENDDINYIRYFIKLRQPDDVLIKEAFMKVRPRVLRLIYKYHPEAFKKNQNNEELAYFIYAYNKSNLTLLKWLIAIITENQKDKDKLKSLVENAVDYYIDDKNVFHYACMHCNIPLVRYLLKEWKRHFYIGEEFNSKEKQMERTPLFFASESGSLELVRFLVEECRVSIFEKDKNGKGLLDVAKPKNMRKYLYYRQLFYESKLEDELKYSLCCCTGFWYYI